MGTVQKTLTALLNGRTDDNIIGYYFGLYRREDDNYKAFLFDVTDAYKYVPTFCNNLFECFCSAPHGMTTGYSECDGKIIPCAVGRKRRNGKNGGNTDENSRRIYGICVRK